MRTLERPKTKFSVATPKGQPIAFGVSNETGWYVQTVSEDTGRLWTRFYKTKRGMEACVDRLVTGTLIPTRKNMVNG